MREAQAQQPQPRGVSGGVWGVGSEPLPPASFFFFAVIYTTRIRTPNKANLCCTTVQVAGRAATHAGPKPILHFPFCLLKIFRVIF